MLIADRTTQQSHAGSIGQVAIGIEANAVAFASLMNNLARDKVGYPVREICSNAWDASRGDFDVHLPTPLDPTFRVRDYGPGISHERMTTLYATLYASTKRSDNAAVGGWGLGRMSPFAYLMNESGSGAFTVTSIHGGEKRIYALSIDPSGLPVMRLMVCVLTDERPGLDVSFPVARADRDRFAEAARTILWSFEPRPRVTPVPEWDEPDPVDRGEGWTLHRRDTVPFSTPSVRMGCVTYEIDLDQVDHVGMVQRNAPLLLEAPIGSLSVTLSRESLAYDDRTKATLSRSVRAYEEALVAGVERDVAAQDNYFKACERFESRTDEIGSVARRHLRERVTWNGLMLQNHVHVSGSTMLVTGGVGIFDKFKSETVSMASLARRDDLAIALQHRKDFTRERLVAAGLGRRPVLLIRTGKRKAGEVLAQLGNPDGVILLDGFDVAANRPATVRRRTVVEVKDHTLSIDVRDVDLSVPGYLIDSRRRSYSRGGREYNVSGDHSTNWINERNLRDAMNASTTLGFIPEGTVLVVDNGHHHEGWTFLGEAVIPRLQAMVTPDTVEFGQPRTFQHLPREIRKLCAAVARPCHAPDDVMGFARQVDIAFPSGDHAAMPVKTDAQKAVDVLRTMGQVVRVRPSDDATGPLLEGYERLAGKYPLLPRLISSYGFSDEERSLLRHYLELLANQVMTDEVRDAA